MNYEFLPEADEEFREASRYYENEAPGVGLAFIAEVHRVISVVISHPRAAKKCVDLSAASYSCISPTVCCIPSKPTWS